MSNQGSRLTNFTHRHFFLLISNDTDMKIPFDVLTTKYKTVQDMKELIGNIIKIQSNEFKISNLLENQSILPIKDKSNIKIEFNKTCKDIGFLLPGKGQPNKIEKCNDLCFEQIIPKFKDFNFYVSDKCSKTNLNLEIFNTKIKNHRLKFDFVPIGINIRVIPDEKAVIIDFNEKKFAFQAGENIKKSEEFIQKVLNIAGASICSEGQKLNKATLMPNGKYKISTMCSYQFIDPFGKISNQLLEYNATVRDAKILFAAIYSTNQQLTANDVIILDDTKKIDNLNMKLSDIEKLRFDIIGKKNVALVPNTNPEKTKIKRDKKESNPVISNAKPKVPAIKPEPKSPTLKPTKPPEKPTIAPTKPKTPELQQKTLKTKTLTIKPTKPPEKSTTTQTNSKLPKSTIQPKPTPKEEEKPQEKQKPKPKPPRVTISTAPVQDSDDDSTVTTTSFINIYFIFEESTGKTIKPPKNKFDPDTTIKEIASLISKRYDIPEIVEIKYKDGNEKVTVDRDMTIDDIRDEIVQKEGEKSRNILYIGHKPQKNPTEKNSQHKIAKNYKPTYSLINESESESESESENDNNDQDHFVFEFDDDERDFLLKTESLLSDNIALIKKKYNINEKDEIGFKLAKIDDEEDDGEIITNNKQKMKNFEDKKIIVYLTSEDAESIYLTVKRMKDRNAIIKTYSFMTNVDNKRREVDLDTKATVKSLKRAVHRIKFFRKTRVCDMKIIFAGKDLLDDLILDKLGIGNALLYVYIRSTDDILLMTAKALRVDSDDDDDDD